MRSSIVLSLLAAAAFVEAAHGSGGHKAPHRRHHAKVKKSAKSSSGGGKCRVKSAGKSVAGASVKLAAAAGKKASNATSSSSGMSGLNMNGVYIGFVPDEGDAGGSRQSMAQLNGLMKGAKSATYGWYAQAHSGTLFDGSQLLAVMDDVIASGAVFEPAVMPTGGWQGLTASDNSQAVAICKVMKQFTDKGVDVRLRFAHEVNYYQTDGTYQGNADDFKAGWAAVSAACKSIAPSVKMFFTPNIANLAQYQQYWPPQGDVAICGLDFYPQDISTGQEFVTAMKPFHDFCAAKGAKFAIGETGLGWGGTPAQRMAWLQQIVQSKSSLPNLMSVSWFNFQKGYDFMILDPNAGATTAALMNFLSSGKAS